MSVTPFEFLLPKEKYFKKLNYYYYIKFKKMSIPNSPSLSISETPTMLKESEIIYT